LELLLWFPAQDPNPEQDLIFGNFLLRKRRHLHFDRFTPI
jgi:hypothetical protein